jgi:putative endonuclease
MLAGVYIAFIALLNFDADAFGCPRAIMWYVYIIRSISFPDREYTGASEHLKQRIIDHNAGKSTHTAKFKPWNLVWYSAFPDKYRALEFEKYLKSHSGRAFAKKRLL